MKGYCDLLGIAVLYFYVDVEGEASFINNKKCRNTEYCCTIVLYIYYILYYIYILYTTSMIVEALRVVP